MIPNKLGERTILEDAVALRTLLVMDHVKASTNAGQSIPSDGAYHTVVFEDEEYDTDAEYVAATGIFTAKRAGYLHITTRAMFVATTTWAATESILLRVFINDVANNYLCCKTDMSGANIYAEALGSVTVLLALGDTVKIKLRQDSGGALSLVTDNNHNYVCLDWLF